MLTIRFSGSLQGAEEISYTCPSGVTIAPDKDGVPKLQFGHGKDSYAVWKEGQWLIGHKAGTAYSRLAISNGEEP